MHLRRFLSNLAKTFLAVSALSVSAYAGADDYNYSGSGPAFPPSCCPSNYCQSGPGCCQNDCSCGFPCNPAPCCEWGYNPPAYPRCGCDTGCCGGFLDSFAFRADFLWWRACEEGIQLGTEEFTEAFQTSTTPPRFAVINRSHEKQPDFKYDPGFRIGFANYCACDCWDFAVNWTHFHTKARSRGFTDIDPTVGAPSVRFISDWERVVQPDFFPQLATGRYSLNLDLVDIEFGRKFYVSDCFVLRPDFGLRIARINQSFRYASESNVATAPEPFTDFATFSKSRCNFLAIGPRVGLDVELRLGCGLTVFGCGAGSIVFGKFDNHSRETAFDFTTSSAPVIGEFDYEQKSKAHRCSRAITDLAFGIKWDRCYEWCGRCHPVTLAFAWEHHAFFNMNNFNFKARGLTGELGAPEFLTTERKHGDLFTQGLTVSLAFGF